MKFSPLSALALLALLGPANAVPAASLDESADALGELDNLASQIKTSQLEALEAQNESLVKRGVKPTCHIGNLAIRRE